MKNQPIIFLDIDGILNSKEWCERNPFALGWEGWRNQLDPVLVERMNRIVMCTGATVVLSSTWRFSWTAESITKLLTECGGTFTVSDVTPPEALKSWTHEPLPIRPAHQDSSSMGWPERAGPPTARRQRAARLRCYMFQAWSFRNFSVT